MESLNRNATFLSLIVKGDKHQAAKAAVYRGVPFAFVRETRHGETVGRVGMQHRAAVVEWFSEDLGRSPSGLAVGSLLLWTEH